MNTKKAQTETYKEEMKGYKLTDQEGKTHGMTQWGPSVRHKALGKGKKLCSTDCIHDYKSPFHAVLFNLIGANFSYPLLWEGKGQGLKADDGIKRGWAEYTTIKQIPLPDIPLEKMIEIAIRVTKKIYTEVACTAWANNWLSGEDRSEAAAWAAAGAAWAAERQWQTERLLAYLNGEVKHD